MPQRPITEHDLGEALTATADVLSQHRVSYAVIGGMAAGFRSQPRFTKDVDFLLQVSQVQLAPLLDTFSERGFEFDLSAAVREWTQHHMTSLTYQGIPVDWLKPILPPFNHVLDQATEESWLNHTIRVASPEGLILLKLFAFRTQDLLDIENLVAAHRTRLDLDWIRTEWGSVATNDDPRIVKLMDLVGIR